ncbi:MAG: acetyl-CoA carboxylase biotin carboxyl carrier protein [Cytophagaceae bacterium]|nr:acetyl-CoA carboxylase biotin carboxyl carrier protein [Cytophagaceae bacterium]
MKPKEIQELIDFVANSGLAEVNIETEEFKLNIKKYPDVVASQAPMYSLPQVAQQAIAQGATTNAPVAKTEVPAVEVKSNLITIKSPMIGTFYRSAGPDKPLFVNVGDEVSVGKTVCIIEAMKLFNEIESEISGTIVKILVDNATPVEYDQPLFLVEPK